MWYTRLFRRHLLDMHIDDWSPEFLSRFSPETYVENLKRAKINYAMVYFQSHAGLCYYPTKTGVMHSAFVGREDQMKRLVDLCHENNIRVCGYYSLIHNTREHDRRPEWRMLMADGQSRREAAVRRGDERTESEARAARYGFVCPNNPDYRAFVLAQIDEMLSYFQPDAMFFDMPFWPHDCHCAHCQAAYGGPIPVQPAIGSEEYMRYTQFRYDAMDDFVRMVTAHVKLRCPDMPVEHNYAMSIAGTEAHACGEGVAAQCDYVGGDLYGNLYNHSFACKYFRAASRNQPFEQMFSRCKPALSSHTLTKSEDEMKTAMAVTMAHHGATLVIDAIDPDGSMNSRVYDRVGRAFSLQAPYEAYFRGDMLADVAVYYGVRSNIAGQAYGSCACSRNLGRTLIRAHIPFSVTGSFAPLAPYRFIFAPMLSALEEKDNERLARYVAGGGTLYLSGMGNRKLVEKLCGHRFLRTTEETHVYLQPEAGAPWEEPLPFSGSAPVVAPGSGCRVLATLRLPYTRPRDVRYASIHSNPPAGRTDIPALTVSTYGRGKVIWSAVPLEAVEYTEFRTVICALLKDALPDVLPLSPDAPGHVELTAFRDGSELMISAAVLCEETEAIPSLPFTVSVRTQQQPASVVLLPEQTAVPFTWEDGILRFAARSVNIFDMYLVQLQNDA